jgi:hypothetical protein
LAAAAFVDAVPEGATVCCAVPAASNIGCGLNRPDRDTAPAAAATPAEAAASIVE